MNLYAQQAHNRWVTGLLFAGFVLLLLGFGLILDAWLSGTIDLGGVAWPFPFYTSLALGIGLVGALGSYLAGARLVLGSLNARPLDERNPAERRLKDVVEEMAIAAGLPVPAIYVLPDPSPNALSTGRSPANASIAVTQGLLDVMDREELEGVIGHEMAHIRNDDIRTMTVVAVLLGSVAALANMAWWSRYGRADRRDRGPVIAIVAIVFTLLAPLVARLIAMAVSRSREFEADRTSAELTRDPLGLARALAKLESGPPAERRVNPGVAPMFIADPWRGLAQAPAELFATHPPIPQRIARLEELAYAPPADDPSSRHTKAPS